MTWRLAPAVKAIFDSANRIAPNRSKASDGTIGDPAHSARTSDHNPDSDGYVMAGDLTHDPANGIDCGVLAEQAIKDPRAKYVIYRSRIWSVNDPVWRVYRGTNPHDKHMHISVAKAERYDDSPWFAAPKQEELMVKIWNIGGHLYGALYVNGGKTPVQAWHLSQAQADNLVRGDCPQEKQGPEVLKLVEVIGSMP